MTTNRPRHPERNMPDDDRSNDGDRFLPGLSSDSENGLHLKGTVSTPDKPGVPKVWIDAPHVFFNRTTYPGVNTISLVAANLNSAATHTLGLTPPPEVEELVHAIATMMTTPWNLSIITPEVQALCDLLGVDPKFFTYQQIRKAILARL